MSEISAKLVSELREKTGLGMMDCKKALVESQGDIEAAITALRKKGELKAGAKADRRDCQLHSHAGESGCVD